jgi:hypothetical protein
MIIGPSFIWLHLPKTGGTSTARLFRELSVENIIVDDDETDSKHDSWSIRFTESDLDIDTKKAFITLRQLPAWLISDWHHKTFSMGLELPFEPVRSGLFYSLRLGGTWVAADYWLHYFEIEKCDAVIRLEHLEEDANRHIHPLLPEGVPKLRFSYHNAKQYTRRLSRYLNSTDIKRIYDNNPFWKRWENKAYGRETRLSLVDQIYSMRRIIE